MARLIDKILNIYIYIYRHICFSGLFTQLLYLKLYQYQYGEVTKDMNLHRSEDSYKLC